MKKLYEIITPCSFTEASDAVAGNKRMPVKHTLTRVILVVIFLLAVSCTGNEPPTQRKYRWDDDGMLVIDGERTFIIGSYHLPKAKDPYRELSENGYNLIRIPPNTEALDAAKENGLMAWVTTGSISRENWDKDRERIGKLVNDLRNHPAHLIWEIADEPAWMWNSAERRVEPGLMKETYELIKTEDPEHLVYTNQAPTNLVSTIQKYNEATDIVACDIYPVIPYGITPSYALFPDGMQGDLLNTYLSQVGEYADKMLRVTEGSKPLFMVLQGFAWENLKKEKERDSSMILYPSFEESRFMAYNAIVHGAVGINYWGMSFTPQPSPFINDLNRLTRELAVMQEILASLSIHRDLETEYHELGYSVDAGVETIVKEVNGNTDMITVNSDRTPAKICFRGLEGFKKAIVMEEGRSVEIADNTLTDYYKPFDVHIYELEKPYETN